MKLDKSKKYGIIGGVHGIARFEQGGKLFDNQGNLLGADGMPLKGKAAPVEEAAGGDEGSNEGTNETGKEPSKDELFTKAKALGIPATKTWGVAKLAEAIAAAEAAQVDQVSKSLEG